jgi:hypothetical protein
MTAARIADGDIDKQAEEVLEYGGETDHRKGICRRGVD